VHLSISKPSSTKFFLQPVPIGFEILRPSKKVVDQIVCGHAPARFENGFSVAQRRFRG